MVYAKIRKFQPWSFFHRLFKYIKQIIYLNPLGAKQEFTVPEDYPVGEVIGHVETASDADSGINAQIHYHLVAVSGKDSKHYLNAFAVRRRTGEIVLRNPLNREEKSRCGNYLIKSIFY